MTFNTNREVKISSQLNSAITWRDLPMSGVGAPNVSEGMVTAVNSDIKLVLSDESYSYAIRNTTSTPFAGFIEKVGQSAVGGALKAIEAVQTITREGSMAAASYNPWFKYIKAWEKTDPISLPLKFEFKMGQYDLWDAKEEVAKPIFALLMPVLPRLINSTAMNGPMRSATQLLASMIGAAFDDPGTIYNIGATLSGIALGELNDYTYRINIGNQFELQYASCIEASVNLSTQVDQSGFPISGSIALTFEGTIPPARTSVDVVSGGRFYNSNVTAATYHLSGGANTEFAESTGG